MRFIDITGQKFGRLTVIKFAYVKNKRTYFLCKCDCSVIKVINRADMVGGKTSSCGCLRIDFPNNQTHGMAKKKNQTRFYRIWCGMKSRCLNKNEPAYPNYGGRGITVCKRWMKFKNFYEDMYQNYLEHVKEFGEKDTSIDRFPNNNGNYTPENTRWSTEEEQQNNKRSNYLITYDGKTLTLTQWSKLTKINWNTIRSRIINKKWPIEKALTLKPTKGRNQYSKK